MTNNDVFTIDINDLTIAEVVLIEEMTGLPLDALGQPDVPKGKMMQALAFISKKRVLRVTTTLTNSVWCDGER